MHAALTGMQILARAPGLDLRNRNDGAYHVVRGGGNGGGLGGAGSGSGGSRTGRHRRWTKALPGKGGERGEGRGGRGGEDGVVVVVGWGGYEAAPYGRLYVSGSV